MKFCVGEMYFLKTAVSFNCAKVRTKDEYERHLQPLMMLQLSIPLGFLNCII